MRVRLPSAVPVLSKASPVLGRGGAFFSTSMFNDNQRLEIVQYAQALVELLDQMYPARCISPGESLEDHLRHAGKRELIDDLRAIGRL